METNNKSDSSQNSQANPPKAQSTTSKLITPVAIILAALIVAGALIFSRPSTNSNTPQVAGTTQTQPATPAVNIKDVNTQNEPYIGKADAPVTIAYWSDYQCPYCKQFEQTVLPQLITNYVNTGKVKVVFKDFQFLDLNDNSPTLDSQTAGVYARAIWSLYPNQYFAWRTAMFNAQDSENTGFGDEASIQALTKTIPGIDEAKVAAAVAANKAQYQSEIDADKAEGEKFGINGTPGFIIGTQLIPGSMPYANFAQAIDALLK